MLAGSSDINWARGNALCELGRWEDLRKDSDAMAPISSRYAESFARFAVNNPRATETLAEADALPFSWAFTYPEHLARFVLAPVLRWSRGEAPLATDDWRRWRDEHRHRLSGLPAARFSILLGEIDRAGFLACCPVQAAREIDVLTGIRCEITGKKAEAAEAYRAYLGIPTDVQFGMIAQFVRQRLHNLEAGIRP